MSRTENGNAVGPESITEETIKRERTGVHDKTVQQKRCKVRGCRRSGETAF